MNSKKGLLIVGALIGLVAVTLTYFGNPANMGLCVACFIRDTAGALGLHRAEAVQYIRPEIIGLVLGSFIVALISKEFAPRGGSAPFTRFLLGAGVGLTALVFLGCPLRMALRLGGGDLNAIIGLVGFIGGIGVGALFLRRGFSLRRSYKLPVLEGAWLPALQFGMLGLLIAAPAFIFFSEKGPGSMHAPLLISLAAGLLIGGLAQRSRLCFAGGVRDIFLLKDWTLIMGLVGVVVAAAIGNLALGSFNLGFSGQPIAHTDGVWNFLSMAAVGFGSVLLGGCPLRQLILAGEGNSDSAITAVGILLGAAVSHNFKLASSVTTVVDGVVSGGPTIGGKIITVAFLLLLVVVAFVNTNRAKEAN